MVFNDFHNLPQIYADFISVAICGKNLIIK